jgi:thioredoxin 1
MAPMSMHNDYVATPPTRAELDALGMPVLLEFGTHWCGYCRAAQPLLAEALRHHAGVRHIKVEDGKGHRLGRSFAVKLWPTVVLLQQGRELARLVRPNSVEEIRRALRLLESAGSPHLS